MADLNTNGTPATDQERANILSELAVTEIPVITADAYSIGPIESKTGTIQLIENAALTTITIEKMDVTPRSGSPIEFISTTSNEIIITAGTGVIINNALSTTEYKFATLIFKENDGSNDVWELKPHAPETYSTTQIDSLLSAKADVSHTHTLSEVTDSGTAAALDVAASGDASLTEVVKGDDTRLTDSRTPLTHTHVIGDVTNLQTELDAKADSVHTHLISDVTNLQIELDAKAPSAHTHLISDVTNLQIELDAKADSVHTHVISDVTNLQTELDAKADSVHTHVIGDVTNLQIELDAKAAATHTHTLSDVTDSGTAAALDVAALGDATAGQIVKGDDSRLSDARTPTAHTHVISEVTNLQTELDGKADATHTHTASEVTDFDTEVSNNIDVAANTAKVSADGSVTTHNDVTDAGSGQIITTAERSKLVGIEAGAEVNDVDSVNGYVGAVVLTKSDVGLSNVTNDEQIPLAQKGANNGVAPLDGFGRVPSFHLPSYVDDVLEFGSITFFPLAGETGKIYVATDTNKVYRWSGTTYIEIANVGVDWGSITGTLSNQTDLQSALDGKSDVGHTHPVTDLEQTGAADGQVLSWNNTATEWQPTPVGNITLTTFSTPLQTITSEGALTIAHPHSGTPEIVKATLVCIDPLGANGYAQNDEVQWEGMNNSSGGPDQRGVSIVADASNINIRYGASGAVFRGINKLTGHAENFNNNSWEIKFNSIKF
jgi:hypothetical protein